MAASTSFVYLDGLPTFAFSHRIGFKGLQLPLGAICCMLDGILPFDGI
jgi:hypothetical protein